MGMSRHQHQFPVSFKRRTAHSCARSHHDAQNAQHTPYGDLMRFYLIDPSCTPHEPLILSFRPRGVGMYPTISVLAISALRIAQPAPT